MNTDSKPLAELHVHLDGSLRLQTLLDLARDQGIALPAGDEQGLTDRIFRPSYASLDEYLAGFGLTCSVMGNPEAVRRISRELFLDAAAEGVRYLEARMAPQLLARPGFTVHQVLAAMDQGFRDAEDLLNPCLRPGQAAYRHVIIPCAMRFAGPGYGWIYAELDDKGFKGLDLAVEAARLLLEELTEARQDLGKVVSVLDLAGSEIAGPGNAFEGIFGEAVRRDFAITVHAGEARGASSMLTALKSLGARRIGHGTALFAPWLDRSDEAPADRKALADLIRRENICIEVCLKSNLDTRAVTDLNDHPLRTMLDNGIPVCLNTDNRLVSHTTLQEEFDRARTMQGLTVQEEADLVMNGFRHAFFPGTNAEHKDYCVRIEAELQAPGH